MQHATQGPTPAAWTAAEATAETSWIYRLRSTDSSELLQAVRAAHVPGKPLLSYRRSDFPLRSCLEVLGRAFHEAGHGRGMALVKGLPRESLTPEEFELMTWAIGLHFGVARPQNRASAYMNEVKDVGTVYRSATGRGYSSNSELDFHVDGADVVLLSCYNQAPVGGMSMCSSSVKAWEVIRAERPDLAEVLRTPFPFSRNGEQTADQEPWYMSPIFGFEGGRTFCMWVRNRVENSQRLPGAPQLSPLQREALDFLDAVVRRPELMYCMHLEAGDLQLLSNHTALHSRTEFEDHPDEARKRTLYRLWIATPDSPPLPAGWEQFYGTREAGVVRGGIRGQQYDDACSAFDREQASAIRMALT